MFFSCDVRINSINVGADPSISAIRTAPCSQCAHAPIPFWAAERCPRLSRYIVIPNGHTESRIETDHRQSRNVLKTLLLPLLVARRLPHSLSPGTGVPGWCTVAPSYQKSLPGLCLRMESLQEARLRVARPGRGPYPLCLMLGALAL
jgi:hypothetical protein